MLLKPLSFKSINKIFAFLCGAPASRQAGLCLRVVIRLLLIKIRTLKYLICRFSNKP
jgi:hypothetical protein